MGYIEDLRNIIGHRPIILVGAVTVILDEFGRILMQERTYPEGKWGLPGGLMELGESTEETAKREVFEETGLSIDELNLINVYSGPDYFITAKNGDEFYNVTIAYYTNNVKGELEVDLRESITCEYFYPSDLPKTIVGSHKEIIDEFLSKHLQNEDIAVVNT